MMDLLDEMSLENATLSKEQDEQFYCCQRTAKSNVNSVSIERKTKERTKRHTCRNTEYTQRERIKKGKKESKNRCSRMP